MVDDWQEVVRTLNQIEIKANLNNEPVTINGKLDGLYCIGVGTDAAVFRYVNAPNYAFKVYASERISKKVFEYEVYKRLGDTPFFPKLFGMGDKFLILSFEEGITLYDCILRGISIPNQVIEDVEDARNYVRARGLNPRDIHLKNILLINGRAKILDVSEYLQNGNDFRWEHLKKGYEEYYHLIDGKPIPVWLVETVRKWYNQMKDNHFSFEEFMKKVTKHTLFWK